MLNRPFTLIANGCDFNVPVCCLSRDLNLLLVFDMAGR